MGGAGAREGMLGLCDERGTTARRWGSVTVEVGWRMDGGWGGQVAREVKGFVHSVACLGCSCWGRHWESWRLGGCIGEMK
jgi:hypothetical protein